MEILVMEITPEMARAWLRSNTRNRSIRATKVEQYAGDMKQGLWACNGETIKWMGDPRTGEPAVLLDGQHRLLACDRADSRFESAVVFDAPDAIETIDIGSKRIAADTLTIRGEKNAKPLAALVSWVYRRDVDAFSSDWKVTPLPLIVENYAATVPGLREAVAYVGSLRGIGQLMPASLAAYIYYEAAARIPDKARAFMEALCYGVGLERDSPVRLLRERLQANRADRRSKMINREILALSTKAWNAFAYDRPMRLLRWVTAEPFPVFLPAITP